MRKTLLFVCLVALPLMTVGCVSMALPRVPAELNAAAATPPLNTVDRASWEAGRSDLQRALLDNVFGAMPATVATRIVSHAVIDAAAFDGAAQIEQYTLEMAGFQTHLAIVLPANATGPVPMIVMENFCGNQAALGGREDIAGPEPASHAPDCTGMMGGTVVPVIFGEYITEPPVTLILSHGYGLAMIYAGDIVPDSLDAAPGRLAELVPGQDSGAIAAWAWVYSRVIDVLDSDSRFDAAHTAIWGHSRNAKAAVLAAAFDPRIDLVIAHQAGTAGTALAHTGVGEPISAITEDYPHWFAPAFATYAERREALPVDMHQLIALIAPRPVLIGGSWRDQWSDPQSSFRAAEGATPIYRLYGSQGLTQSGLIGFDPTADLAVAMRPGLHGVHAEDWDNFLAFLDAHFATN